MHMEVTKDYAHADEVYDIHEDFFQQFNFVEIQYWKVDYEEQRGRLDRAREVLLGLQAGKNVKIEHFMRHAQLERRNLGEEGLGDERFVKAVDVYDRALAAFESSEYITIFLLQEYATFLRKVPPIFHMALTLLFLTTS